jgi:putative FmdB family regulatory protein
MPIYQYECRVCGERFERLEKSGSTLPRCPRGHAEVRRCFCPPSIIFHGSGFYCTDNRSARPGNEKST